MNLMARDFANCIGWVWFAIKSCAKSSNRVSLHPMVLDKRIAGCCRLLECLTRNCMNNNQHRCGCENWPVACQISWKCRTSQAAKPLLVNSWSSVINRVPCSFMFLVDLPPTRKPLANCRMERRPKVQQGNETVVADPWKRFTSALVSIEGGISD